MLVRVNGIVVDVVKEGERVFAFVDCVERVVVGETEVVRDVE
jgi:hypothetical protein